MKYLERQDRADDLVRQAREKQGQAAQLTRALNLKISRAYVAERAEISRLDAEAEQLRSEAKKLTERKPLNDDNR